MKGKPVTFEAIINKFGNQGEKTGWRYVLISAVLAQQILPVNKKAFRVTGKIDKFPIDRLAVMPMGDGTFILTLNAAIRKGIGKKEGQKVTINLKHDTREQVLDQDLLDCLEEDPVSKELFFKLAPSHRNYYSKWIAEAKTQTTKAKRIAMTLDALIKKMNFGEMLREAKKKS